MWRGPPSTPHQLWPRFTSVPLLAPDIAAEAAKGVGGESARISTRAGRPLRCFGRVRRAEVPPPMLRARPFRCRHIRRPARCGHRAGQGRGQPEPGECPDTIKLPGQLSGGHAPGPATYCTVLISALARYLTPVSHRNGAQARACAEWQAPEAAPERHIRACG